MFSTQKYLLYGNGKGSSNILKSPLLDNGLILTMIMEGKLPTLQIHFLY